MNLTDSNKIGSKRSLRQWLRVLRPMSWWIILVLILYTIRTHQILNGETCLTFDASVEGKRFDAISATLDGNPVVSGSKVGVGRHRITFSHRKAETITTNILVWYGGCDLMDVVLKRSKGTISVTAVPAVQLLVISGPEFRVEFTNCIGFTSSVPTDAYLISANWLNDRETNRVNVIAGNDSLVRYLPSLGTLSFLTEPAGARVIGKDGDQLGVTPLLLHEMRAGSWRGELRLDGFVPVNVTFRVLPNQTNSFRTNLVSWEYAQAIEEARRGYAAHEYDRAAEAIEAALRANSEVPDAKSLRDKIVFARHMQRGQRFFEQSRYTDARQEIEGALRIQPANDEAKALLAKTSKQEEEALSEQKKREAQELAERTRRERLNSLHQTMSSVTREHLDAGLFDLQGLAFTNNVKELGRAIQQALSTKLPTFEIEKFYWENEQIFILQAKQPAYGGLRECLITGAQTGDSESTVLFRVLEYETHLNVNVGGVFKLSDGQPPLVALPNRKDRVTEGIQSMTVRLKGSVL